MTTTRPHTNRDDVSELGRLRREYHAAKRVLGEVRYHDRYIARLEAAYRSAVSLIDYWQALAEKAEAEVALRDRMLVAEYDSHTPKTAGYMRWFTDLRAQAEKEASDG
jgi:hypothetical protein